jgi:hypothetical protein
LEYSLSEVGDELLTLFFSLVRNIPDAKLVSLFQQCLIAAATAMNVMRDLFVLVFQTRDCRGGKGERLLFYKMFLMLGHFSPARTMALIPLIGEYGCWKDYFSLLEAMDPKSSISSSESEAAGEATTASGSGPAKDLSDCILNFIAKTLKEDFRKADEYELSGSASAIPKPSLTLASKFAPREKSPFHLTHKRLFDQLLDLIFPDLIGDKSKQKRLYRQHLSKCGKLLDVTEIKMCDREFGEIDFSNVSSLGLKRYTKAFLNEPLEKNVSSFMTKNGLRFPDDEDRMTA